MSTRPVNLAAKLASFEDQWSPKVVGELNGQYVKLVKVKGAYVWHHHEREDEMFLVLKGSLIIELEDRDHVRLGEGEFFIVPRGVKHRPVAHDEAHILLFEPATVRNTGNIADHEYTLEPDELEWM